MCEGYNTCFGMPVGDQDKALEHNFIFGFCDKTLKGKTNGRMVFVKVF